MYEKGEEVRKLLHLTSSSEGFPDSSVGKESACNVGSLVRFLGQEDPLEKGQATHSRALGLPLWLSW